MRRVMEESLKFEGLSFKEQTVLLVFLVHCFNSMVTLSAFSLLCMYIHYYSRIVFNTCS